VRFQSPEYSIPEESLMSCKTAIVSGLIALCVPFAAHAIEPVGAHAFNVVSPVDLATLTPENF